MSDHVIEIEGLAKSYQGSQVLDHIDLSVKNGEFLTLLGPSGCGKTTLLRLISGFDVPDAGDIKIAGKSVVQSSPENRNVNTVFQSYALFPHMSVYDNVAFGLRAKKVDEENIQKRVNDVLRMVKLDRFSNRKPHQLSGGQQQRVAIARAVVNEPLVLLLDEPLSSLDSRLRLDMQVELKALQRKLGITFIFVTHDQEEALSMSDRVVVLKDGKIEQIGTPREIYENPTNLSVADFIGKANLFEAIILKREGKSAKVTIENQSFLIEGAKDFKEGEHVHILIRPEDLTVWAPKEIEGKDKERMLPAEVKEVIYKGSTVDLMVQLASGKVLSATEFFNEDDETLDFEVGEKVWVEWIPGWEVLLRDEKA